MGFFQSLGNFFKKLFGGKPNKPTAPAPVITPAKPQQKPPPPPDPVIKVKRKENGKTLLSIERLRTQGGAIQGKVLLEGQPIAHSLEQEQGALAPGTYSLQLRESGGLHATYGFRYPDMHEGLIQIGDKFAYLRTGGKAHDAQGGIVLAESINDGGNELEAWHSDQAYRKVYPRLKAMLQDGEAISLLIS